MKHILSASQFDRHSLVELFDFADDIKAVPKAYLGALQGKVITTMFFEPSTRTRMSFGAAVLRLGGKLLSTENAKENSSSTKGESFADAMRMLELYSDCVVVRAKDQKELERIAQTMTVPIINAGMGSGEHPTQALLDLYTIRCVKGKIDNLSILVTGDLKYGRTVHSLVQMLSHFEDISVYCLSDSRLQLPQSYVDWCKQKNIKLCTVKSVDAVPKDIDCLYSTRVQRERLLGQDATDCNFEQFVVDNKSMSRFGKHTIVLHPLPRTDEINPEFDTDPRAVYFEQAKNGMFVRMALLVNCVINDK